MSLIVIIYALINYKITSLNANNTFVGGDISGEMFAIKIATKANLIGVINTVGWPHGFGLWAEPLLGLGPYYFALIISKLFAFSNVAIIYTLTMAAGIMFNSIAAWWMVVKEFSDKKFALYFGLIIGISPFALMRFGHMPVAWLFFPFIFLGIAFRLSRNQISRGRAVLILAITGLWSPLWWIIVFLLIALLINVVQLLNLKKNKKNCIDWFMILIGTTISLIPSLILNFLSRNYAGQTSRFPWQSNKFGGKFSDILLSSPFINQAFELKTKLSEGVSPESINSLVGIVLGIFVFYLILQILLNQKIQNKFLPTNFYLISVVILLFFVTGGFGNLQAGLLVILDQVSPARSWFRLIFFLGILGLFLFLKEIENRKLRSTTINILMSGSILLTIFDSQFIEFPKAVNKQDIAEYNAVKFLDSTTQNCPVLQIPVDTFPLPQDFTFANGSKFAYNQLIPYLLSDNNQWSLVGIPGNKYWEEYKAIPTELEKTDFLEFKEQGFCAILFDKDFSDWQITRKAGVDFTQGLWPGLKVNVENPDFEDLRYKVYLLD
jgi:hypothetical protein